MQTPRFIGYAPSLAVVCQYSANLSG